MIRYTITAVKKDGLRHLACDNNHLSHFDTEAQAKQHLKNMIKNNNPETLAEIVGIKLKVQAVECYSTGDAKRTIF